MNDDVKVVLGFLAGSIVGYAIGVLAAPDEGGQLRDKILTEADRLAQKLIDDGTQMIEKASDHK
ncbi:MAG: YtxH domain-containing protein [Bacteroidota bacterium]